MEGMSNNTHTEYITNSREDYTSTQRSKSGVSVVVRIRPQTSRDFSNSYDLNNVNKRPVIYADSLSQNTVYLENNYDKRMYTFDHVAGPSTTQQDMFEHCGRPIVESCLDGYNGTIFCYGQTGAGKTYTMIGPDQDTGLIPRILDTLFDSIYKRRVADSNWRASLKVSFLEIYNEKIQDLLANQESTGTIVPQKKKDLEIREDHRKRLVFVEGLSKFDIESANEGLILLQDGLINRHVGSTRMNSESSRSHSVFTIKIKSIQVDSSAVTHKKTSYLHLIDLAGSERQQSTGTEGDRLKEACNINKTLSQLAMVINHLTEVAKGKQLHIPYRDSKLTYLLKDSLGGNSKTVIIANVSPSSSHATESLQTLEFAKRAKNIKNKPMVNEVQKGDVDALRRRIQLLEEQLQMQQPTPYNISISRNEKEEYDSRIQSFLNRIEQYERSHILLQQQVEQQTKITEGKEMLLNATRLALKLKECTLAQLQNRRPEFTRSILSEIDPTNGEMEIDQVGDTPTNGEETIRQLQEIIQRVWHPDRHPTVITYAMENYELKEKLEQYESDQNLTEYVRVLQQQLFDLIKNKHETIEQVEEKETTKRLKDSEALSQTESLITALKEENAALTRRLEEIKQQQEDMMPLNEVEQIVSELEATRCQRDAMNAMNAELETQIEKLKQQIHCMEQEKREVEESQASQQTLITNLQQKLDSVQGIMSENEMLKVQNGKWKLEYDSECAKTVEQSRAIHDLMQQINQQRKQMDQIREEQEERDRILMAKNHEITILSQQLSDDQVAIDELRIALGNEQRRFQLLEKKQVECEENQQAAQFDKMSDLMRQINHSSAELEQLRVANSSLSSQNSALLNEREQLSIEMGLLQQRAATFDQLELNLRSQCKSAQEMNLQLQSQLEKVKVTNDLLEKEKSELLGHNNHKQKIKQVMQMKLENNTLKSRVKELEKSLSESSKILNKENEASSGETVPSKNTKPIAAESNKVEKLNKQLSAIENTVVNLTRLYNSKKRRYESTNNTNIKGVSTFKKIMNMLGELESLSVNNRGVRGSNNSRL